MRNVYAVLREKEEAIERLRHEIEALRAAIPLLANQIEAKSVTSVPAVGPEVTTETACREGNVLPASAPLLAGEAEDALARIRARLVEASENNFKPRGSQKIARQLRHFIAGRQF